MKKVLIWLVILAISVSLVYSVVGCKTTTTTEATTAAETTAAATTAVAETTVAPVVKRNKIGVIIWSIDDTLGMASKWVLDFAGQALNTEFVYKAGDTDDEAQIKSLENLIAAGCDGILLCNANESSIPRLVKICSDAKVPVIQIYRNIVDPKIASQVVDNPYYLGWTVEGEEVAAYSLIKALVENGGKNLGAITIQPGITVADRRKAGFDKAIKETGINLLSEYVISLPPDASKWVEATENFITTFPELDSIVLVAGAFGGAEATVATIEKYEKVGKVKMATFDLFQDMDIAFQKGITTCVAGGDQTDALFSFIVLYNYLQETPLSDKPVQLNQNYAFVKSYKDTQDFAKYLNNKDIMPYSEDEIKQMTKVYNPDFSLDDLKKIVAAFSIEDIKSRLSAK